MSQRVRILLVAYQCGPGMGSVSQIGWEWYSRLCEKHDVTLVTHVRNKQALISAGAPLPNSEMMLIDTEWFAGPLYRLASRVFPKSEHSVFLVSSLDYFPFDIAACRKIRRQVSQGASWDLVHRVTPVTLAAPSLLGRLGIPTVVGPLNCGLSDPPGFSRLLRAESTWIVKVRGLTRLLDMLWGFSRKAACILVATKATQRQIPTRFQARCYAMLENSVDPCRFIPQPWVDRPGRDMPLRVLFVGRLIPAKALTLLFQAMKRLDGLVPVVLDVVGDGPLRNEWESEACALGLAKRINFHGHQPASAVAHHMRACHVFCLPSIRESGGAVILEAMASARPVIAMNYGGPAELIDNDVGHLVTMDSPDAAVIDLANALHNVYLYPDQWEEKGRVGSARVANQYGWPAKVQVMSEQYAALVKGCYAS